jgi:hypothetical protein
LGVISVSDPAHPVEVGYCDTPGSANSVAVSGDYAYVTDAGSGLRVISVADPAHPAEVGYHDTHAFANGMAVSGDYAYVADLEAGLQIYEFYGGGVGVEEKQGAEVRSPKAPTLVRDVLVLGAAGSRQNTEYGAAPSYGGRCGQLLDACGRNVMELLPGANDVSRLGPGIYFVRSVSRELSAGCQKVVLTR